jgi:hypothetical protein
LKGILVGIGKLQVGYSLRMAIKSKKFQTGGVDGHDPLLIPKKCIRLENTNRRILII